MTWFEIAVPLLGFIVAGAGILFLRREARQIEARSPVPRHPAE
jgi:hypothetical protein